MQLIFEKSIQGRTGVLPPESDVPVSAELDPALKTETEAPLPELSELDVIRHFSELSQHNFGVDSNFYPLGSCTMKYNPRVNEKTAALPGLVDAHPLLPEVPGGEGLVQGAMAILSETESMLSEVNGMDAFTLQPLAGAHGELTGILLMAAYHRKRGNDKNTILVPDSAHGTNPASAKVGGYDVKTVPGNEDGIMDLDALKEMLNDQVAGIMLTNPNTMGIFNSHVSEICDLVHEVDGLVYYDGANLNAIMGKFRPGDAGFDIVHLNLHKTFSTPHGGGGPGAGPVGVAKKLVPFLPTPIVKKNSNDRYTLEYDRPDSIGRIAPFYGNYGVVVRAYTYLLMLGRDGLTEASEVAVLNANYIREKLQDVYKLAYPGVLCKHECVFSANESSVHAVDIAKALLDRGFHAPTVYFPTTVPESMMIEPTETESRQTIDAFVEAMREIADIARNDPEALHNAPEHCYCKRLDETRAARSVKVACLD